MSMQISVEKLFFQVCCVYEKLGLDLIFMQVGIHELYPLVQRGILELQNKIQRTPPVQIRRSKNRKISRFIPRVA